ncbi:MAG: YjbH domain-containing protein [Ignavibacteria bacterium]|jgi:hypothetical protein|nr:YjbH domain-containing protein [Ignavibacteria bacterium]
MNKKSLIVLSILLLTNVSVSLVAAETALEKFEPRYIVDMPSAGMLENLSYSINSQLISNGGFLLDFTASFFKFLNVGISYGGNGVIGSNTMTMQRYPGFHIKARIINEDEGFPAIALGINSQGKGMYISNEKRNEQLPPDFYVAVSKSFKWTLGTFSLNGGVNYSFEDEDNRGINIYAGVEHSVTRFVALALEINPNLNDNHVEIWKDKSKTIMLNGVLRLSPNDNMIIEIQFKDIFRNSRYSDEVGRYFGVQFVSKFF